MDVVEVDNSTGNSGRRRDEGNRKGERGVGERSRETLAT